MPETGQDRPPRFVRTRTGRLIGGVCSGIGAQFGIDPLLVRIVFVGLTFFGGAGFWLYVAILLLVPEEGASRAPIRLRRSTWPKIAGVIALLVAVGIALSAIHYGSLATPAEVAAVFALIALVGLAARYARRRLKAAYACSEERSADLRLAGNVALAVAVTADVTLLALAGAWLAGIDRRLAAWAVVLAGVALIAGAFVRAPRIVAPALAFALAVVVFVAAGVDLHGGLGNRVYRPGALREVRSEYRLGAGHLEVDLRNVSFPAGDTPMRIRVGIGAAVVIVPDEVCVITRARMGGGYVGALDRETDGLDVRWSPPPAPRRAARVLRLEGNVGLGALFVVDRPLAGGFQPGLYGTNSACRGASGVSG
ncbi:MAG TPA: PspC domain-containing protein [Solirubrobacteraceae bacterium]|nr:PspC domain-containing protein [Solirubrobacteraceae bacterium]